MYGYPPDDGVATPVLTEEFRMVEHPREPWHPLCPRLNPLVIGVDAAPDEAAVRVKKRFADLRGLDNVVVEPRKSFLECIADYNPLGQWGVSWSSSDRRMRE
jgi:hypothetical protein